MVIPHNSFSLAAQITKKPKKQKAKTSKANV